MAEIESKSKINSRKSGIDIAEKQIKYQKSILKNQIKSLKLRLVEIKTIVEKTKNLNELNSIVSILSDFHTKLNEF